MAELESVKTKLITERNDVASVVRKEFAENLDRLGEENSRMATELQNQVTAVYSIEVKVIESLSL